MKLLLSALFLAFLTACASAQPTAFERTLFNVTTNYTTNVSGVILINTNLQTTNIVYQTNVAVAYHMEPKETTIQTIGTVSSIASTSGLGWAGVAGTFIASLLYGWAELRNSRKAKLVNVLGQNVETGKETIRAVGGEAMAKRYVEQIKGEQADAGVGVRLDAATVADFSVNTARAASAAANDVVLPTIPTKP